MMGNVYLRVACRDAPLTNLNRRARGWSHTVRTPASDGARSERGNAPRHSSAWRLAADAAAMSPARDALTPLRLRST
jgi:hypothetical protein